MTKKEECKNANSNPLCPYLSRINYMEKKLVEIKTDVSGLKVDVSWLKKGYWLQTLTSVGTFLTVLGLVLKIIGVI